MKSRLVSLSYGIIPVAALILLWAAVAASGVAPRALLPSPMAVFLRTIDRLGDPYFLGDIGTTLFAWSAVSGSACSSASRLPCSRPSADQPGWCSTPW